MTFVGDESVDLAVLQALQALGQVVVMVVKECSGASDLEVLSLARAHNAIIITCDKDFGQLVVAQEHPSRGVVLLRLFELNSEQMSQRVADAFNQYGAQWEAAFTVISPSQIRIRALRKGYSAAQAADDRDGI